MKKLLFALFTLFSINSFADCVGLTVNFTMIDPTCPTSCDGHGYVTVSGGSGNYSYNFTNSTYVPVTNQFNDSVFNLCGGTYYVIVNDITNGCLDTNQFIIVDPTPITATVITNQDVTCFGGNDGSLTVIVTGGSGNYYYSWNTGETTQIINGLVAGAYWVDVVDDAGGFCGTTVTGVVNEPQPLVVTATANDATCGQCDGLAVGLVSGGTSPYSYLWDDPVNTVGPTAPNLCPGTYMLTVVDANGCVGFYSVAVGTTTNIAVTTTSTISSCSACTGTITVIESGGTAPYTYDVTNQPQQSNGNFSNVCPGSYQVTVTDSQGCTGFAGGLVSTNQIGGLTVVDSIQHESGAGANDGFIDLILSGSTGPYTFLWSNGATTEDIYSLGAGTYSVVVTDNNGDCSTYIFTITTTPSYGYITGQLYNDQNQNCVFDAGDSPLTNYYVVVTDGVNTYYGFTNANGEYSIWVPSGNYTVTPYNSTGVVTACNTSYNVTVTNGSTISGNDFSYFFPPYYDVCVYAWSPGIVPGFDGTYYVYLSNNGNMPADGELCFVLPAGLTLIGTNPAATSISGDTVCFTYTGLQPFNTDYYIVDFNAPSSLPLGTPMIACMEATVTNGVDANPGCNSYCYTRIVSGSFDPNDKSVSPAGENATGDILVNEDEFTYLVRFQNTGTGPAVNVVVYDTLSSLLDPSTIEILNASHSYVAEIINGNVLRFKFENIMLPDSGSNEPASHGHIQFKIKTLSAPVIGQEINNTADIYFDFNEPVITNTTVNTYVAPNGINDISAKDGLYVYPNPASEMLYIQNLNGGSKYLIMDISGKMVMNKMINGMNATFDIHELKPGVYFLQSENSASIQTVKFIKR